MSAEDSGDGVSVEPDALSVWRKGKTELVWYPGNPQDKVEASFYSGSTVAAAIQDRIEKFESDIEEVRNCDIENCEYDMSEEEHTRDEFFALGAKMALEELDDVFSEVVLNDG